jgi:hypothetical protein
MLLAGVAPYLEARIGEHFTYSQAMGGLATVAFLVGSLIIGLGPEAHGVTFRKGGESFSRLTKKTG